MVLRLELTERLRRLQFGILEIPEIALLSTGDAVKPGERWPPRTAGRWVVTEKNTEKQVVALLPLLKDPGISTPHSRFSAIRGGTAAHRI